MIPRVQTGGSFKGAGLYYLHDKRGAGEAVRLTTARVAWTHARNTMEEEPEEVLAEMRKTAFDQPMLKMMSGNRIDGRPTEKPVMTVALAWSPDQRPTQPEMIAAAEAYLDHMGWGEHQCLVVAHNDTAHPHVHLIINRIHPETGMTQDKAWVKHRSQEWALAYEREQGQVLCVAREEKYGQAQTIGPDGSMTRAELTAWKKADRRTFGTDRPPSTWEALKADQRAERMAFWKDTGLQRRELRAEVARQVKHEFAGEWAAYAAQRDERRQAAKLYDAEARRAIRHYRKLHSVDGVAAIKERQDAYHARLKTELIAARQPIAERQAERMAEVGLMAQEELGKQRQDAYNALLAGQRGEKATLRQPQAAETGSTGPSAQVKPADPPVPSAPDARRPHDPAVPPSAESYNPFARAPIGGREQDGANPYARDYGDERDQSPDR